MNKYDNTDWSVTFSSSCSHCHLFFSWRVCDAEGWVLQHTRRGDKWVFKTPVDWLVRDYTDRSVDWWFWDILGDYTAQYIGDCHNPVWESCLPAIKRWQRVLNTGAPPKIYRYWLLETTCQHMKNGLPRDDCPARPGDLVIFHVHFWWMVGGPNLQKTHQPHVKGCSHAMGKRCSVTTSDTIGFQRCFAAGIWHAHEAAFMHFIHLYPTYSYFILRNVWGLFLVALWPCGSSLNSLQSVHNSQELWLFLNFCHHFDAPGIRSLGTFWAIPKDAANANAGSKSRCRL